MHVHGVFCLFDEYSWRISLVSSKSISNTLIFCNNFIIYLLWMRSHLLSHHVFYWNVGYPLLNMVDQIYKMYKMALMWVLQKCWRSLRNEKNKLVSSLKKMWTYTWRLDSLLAIPWSPYCGTNQWESSILLKLWNALLNDPEQYYGKSNELYGESIKNVFWVYRQQQWKECKAASPQITSWRLHSHHKLPEAKLLCRNNRMLK